jgi:hypothetical protein
VGNKVVAQDLAAKVAASQAVKVDLEAVVSLVDRVALEAVDLADLAVVASLEDRAVE